jgi:hypothetical protein
LALGKTSYEMEDIIRDITFIKLIDLDLRKGAIKGIKIEAFLEKIF